MKRPSDQIKLLFFGFLRTASALASKESKFGSALFSTSTLPEASKHFHSSPHLDEIPLTLRLAKIKDISGMGACNLACLPENYNDAFYMNHIRQWPDLAIVAVLESDDHDQDHRKPPHLSYQPSMSFDAKEHHVVAYVLGKVEERSVPSEICFDDFPALLGGRSRQYVTEVAGHVTSIAVMEPFRRHGLAAALMDQLHFHLEQNNMCSFCGLHVRKSNTGATRLYEKFGYSVTQIIPSYYQDGEDAFYMTKELSPCLAQVEQDDGRAGFLGNIMFRRRNRSNLLSRPSSKPWECGPFQLRLPRPIGLSSDVAESRSNSQTPDVTAELMTGTM